MTMPSLGPAEMVVMVMSGLLRPERGGFRRCVDGTKGCGDPTSPGDVTEVVISHRTWSRGVLQARFGSASGIVGPRRQVQFLGPAKGRPTVVHAKLHVDVLRVGPQGVEGHRELASDIRAAQLGPKEPKHVQFPLTERLD